MLLTFGRRTQIFAWLMLSVSIVSWWSYVFFFSTDKTPLIPGATSHGHYQIELQCSACHDTKPDGMLVSAVSNQACLKCHDQDLEEADDSHPAIKFKKPENRPFLEKIDVQKCVTCHTEHRPNATGKMGVTIPQDYCMHCHQSTIEERETHLGLSFNTCATSGCHNFHDNRALYERHLAIHSMTPPHLPNAKISQTESLKRYLSEHPKVKALTASEADAPENIDLRHEHVQKWVADAHGQAGVNCSACHQPDKAPWENEVAIETCAKCHSDEHQGFLKGKHGMRIAAGLSPMTPGMARLPMHENSAHHSLSCTSCHSSHDFNTKEASYFSCIKCHNDEHTREYQNSPHYALWQRELKGEAPAGTGVSCATCHMPRVDDGAGGLRVEHNQNANLTPNEKMLRPVCQQCHGLPFAIDALSDRDLIRKNFLGPPAIHNESTDWARQRAIKRNDPELMELIRKMSEANPPNPEKTEPNK